MVWVVRYPGEVLPPIKSVEVDSALCMFIKQMALIFANGDVGPVVMVVQWPNLPEGECVLLEIPGLTNTTDGTATGYILVCKSRGGNEKMARIILLQIVLPTMNRRRNIFGYAEDFLTMDGEKVFLNVAKEKEVLEQQRIQCTTSAKLAAATTSKTQACDAEKGIFKGTKSGLAKVLRDFINTENVILEKRIFNALASIVSNPGCEDAKQAPAYMTSMSKSIVTIIFVEKNTGSYTPRSIERAFVVVGQHAPMRGEVGFTEPQYPILNMENLSVDPERMLRCCIRDIEDDEMKQMVESFPEAVCYMKARGTLTRAEMDHLKIPRLPEGLPLRENLEVARQGAIILSHDATIERTAAYDKARRPRTQDEIDAANKAKEQEKEEAKEEKEDDRIIQKAAKKQDTLKRKAEAAAFEKERVNALSTEEKKKERDAKKAKTQDSRRVKAAQEAQKLKAAEDRHNNKNKA